MNLPPRSTNDFSPPHPPAVRMTEDEAQAVIRLWQQEQGSISNRPSLQDIAEGLGIAPEDAHRLLAQVRGAQAGGDIQHARIRREHSRLARRIAWCVAAGALTELLLHFLP